MKEQWKRLDSEAKFLVNVEEGRSQPLKIELPLSALRSSDDFCCNKVLTVLKVILLLFLLVILSSTGFFYFGWPTESDIVIDNKDAISNEPFLRSEEDKLAFRNKVYTSHIDDNNIDESKEFDDIVHQQTSIESKIDVKSRQSKNKEADELKSTFQLINDGMREMSENIKNLNQITQGNIKALTKESNKDLKEQKFLVDVENVEVDKSAPSLLDVLFREVIQVTDINVDVKEEEALNEQSNFNIEQWRQLAKEKIKEMARIQEESFFGQLEKLEKESEERDLFIRPVEVTTKQEKKSELMFIDHLIRDLLLIEDSKSASAENVVESEEENFKKLVKTINESGESSEMFDKIDNDDDLLSLLMYFYTKTDLTNIEDKKEDNKLIEKEEVKDKTLQEEVKEENKLTLDEIAQTEEYQPVSHLMSQLQVVDNGKLKNDKEKKQNTEDKAVENPILSDESIEESEEKGKVVSAEESKEKIPSVEEPKVSKDDESVDEDSFEFPHLRINPKEEVKEKSDDTTTMSDEEQYEITRDRKEAALLARLIGHIANSEVQFKEDKMDYKTIRQFLFGDNVYEVRSNARNVLNMIKSALPTEDLGNIYEHLDNVAHSFLEYFLDIKIKEMFSICRRVEDDALDAEVAKNLLIQSSISFDETAPKDEISKIRNWSMDESHEAVELIDDNKDETHITELKTTDEAAVQKVEQDENNNEELTNDSNEQHTENLLNIMASLVKMFEEPEEEEEEVSEEREKEIHETEIDESAEKRTQDVLDAIQDMSQLLCTQQGTESPEECKRKSSNEELTTEPDTEDAAKLLNTMADLAEFIQKQTATLSDENEEVEEEEEEVEPSVEPLKEYAEDEEYLRYPILDNEEDY